MQEYSTTANYKRVANIYKAITCQVQKYRGNMGEGFPHRYLISKFSNLCMSQGDGKNQNTQYQVGKECMIILNKKHII